MNAMPNLEIICKKVADCYRKIYGDAIRAIYLYGSYARGDYDEESDIDFTAIVEGEQLDLSRRRFKVSNDLSDISLDYDVVISFGVIPANLFEENKNFLAYYKNILKEGKRIG
jgi:predicted nucleotidyltransferase